jgi:hypothetical protein
MEDFLIFVNGELSIQRKKTPSKLALVGDELR